VLEADEAAVEADDDVIDHLDAKRGVPLTVSTLLFR
jgi:hypothetical protein